VPEYRGYARPLDKPSLRRCLGGLSIAATCGCQFRPGTFNLAPEKPLWDLALPSGAMDNFRFTNDRRKSVRVKCSISVELHPAAGPQVVWGKASDLSVGGCFVEMPIPLKVDTAFEIALWLGETKLLLSGKVTNSAPGFGIGVRFVNASPQAHAILQRQVAALLTQG